MRLTIGDAVKFVRANGITALSDDDLTMLIQRSIKYHAFDHVTDSTGAISGLYVGVWEKPYTIFRVHLLLGKGAMLTLMKRFKSRFPLLQTVITGRHQKKLGSARSSYGDETVTKEYHPNTFKLVS